MRNLGRQCYRCRSLTAGVWADKLTPQAASVRPLGSADAAKGKRDNVARLTLGSLQVAQVHTCTNAKQIELESRGWSGLVRF